jgi:MinD-like ATPase involved in chromosome partitioning or flagellar assembly
VTRAIGALPPDALVIVDAPQPFAATVRPFISRASKIVVVTEPTLMGVSVAHASLAAMDRFGILASRIALVVSDLSGKGEISRAEIERALKLPVSAELINARDRRFQGRFDGFLTTLATAPILVRDLGQAIEAPMFDRRNEPGEAPA